MSAGSGATELGQAETPSTIAYRLGNTLYLNITNRCTARCVFCPRQDDFQYREYSLLLSREPTAAELIAAVGDPAQWDEIVFCGYGEPTVRLGVLRHVAKRLRRDGARRLRLNTNGHGNLIHKRDILPELAECFDALSISLNSADPEQYARLMGYRRGGRRYFDAVVEFARRARAALGDVTVTVVDLPEVDVERARQFVATEIGARFRARPVF